MNAPLDTTSTDHLAWLESRRSGIGGSDVAGILGLSPWASPYSVWADKVHGHAEDIDDDKRARLDAGHDAESYLALRFMRDRPGLIVQDVQRRLGRDGETWAFAHVDGMVYDESDCRPAAAIGPWDAKTSNDWTPWGEPPAYYQAQMQWAMWLGDYERAWITAGFSGWKSRTYEIERDPDDIELIVDTCRRFWHDHVITGEPPEVDGHDATSRALRQHHPRHDDGVEAPVDAVTVARWRTLKADERAVKAELRDVQNQLAAQLGDAETGLVDGEAAVTYRSQTRTTTCVECGHQTESQPFRVLRTKGE